MKPGLTHKNFWYLVFYTYGEQLSRLSERTGLRVCACS